MINLADIKDLNSMFDNRYRLIEKIGGGGFSEVWLAHDTSAGLDVALKIYTPNGELDDEGKEDFRREFARLCGLNHSNIIHAIGFGIHNDELPYLAMSVCKNGSAKKLKELQEEDKEEQLWLFIEQVASGLQYLHAHGITHQDIKPDNILINSDGQYLIIDFGISTKTRSTLRKTSEGSVGGGTTWYMSCESYKPESSDIHARDIWALGASLYEIIEGDVPFGQYGGLTQQAKKGKVPPITANISNELKQLIYSCLALEAWDRPDADALLKCAKAHKPGPKPSPSLSFKKVIIALSFLAVVAGCYFAYLYIFPDNNQIDNVVVENRNDSVFLTRIEETSSIISNESQLILGQKESDKISLVKLVSALDLCNEISIMADSVSEETKEKGLTIINSSISDAKKVCQHLEERGDEKFKTYDDFGVGEYAVEVRDKYYSLSDTIKLHINNIKINK